MSSNVGLTTPRGSGTSGYVQRNLSHFRPRDPPTTSSSASPYHPESQDKFRHQQRQPDQQILNHDRLREIEVKVFDLRDKLEDEEISESEIESQTAALRNKLTAASTSSTATTSALGGGGRAPLKPHQVHELAAAKIQESDKFRRALGIRGDYEEGSHWKRQRDGAAEREGDANGVGTRGEAREGRERDNRGREVERERERRW